MISRINTQMDDRTRALIEIGTIFDNIGISSKELAEKVTDHLISCSCSFECLKRIINPEYDEKKA